MQEQSPLPPKEGAKATSLYRNAAILLTTFLLAACGGDRTILTKASYASLPGWAADDHTQPLQLVADSCAANRTRPKAYRNQSGEPIGDREGWQQVCQQVAEPTAVAALRAQPDAARQFFETYFTPYHVTSEEHPQALITGYYEPILKGSRTRTMQYATPVYGLPDAGYRQFTRAEIAHGALQQYAPVLLYVEDPVMLFFMQVQGSGKVELPDGSRVGLQYAGQNGQPYLAIGKVLRERGALETVSMQTIRDWLHAHPESAAEVMQQNPSYVFFQLADGDAYAKGALGLPLTPLRSIAVDNARAAYGVPTYIATMQHDPQTGSEVPLRRLFVSQDTGGALKGPHRTDIFFGRGTAEEWSAGLQNAPGDVYWLLPNVPATPEMADATSATP